ncbi:zinc finger protein [Capsaspora owczarzaki ATCC 30864]|uniref:Palmitoyltransferase n=1 Tax=Capsaspora owczarzaki (strain ATCC 30864) TaxID=595528 RepID=A0A0D2WVB0_CAPO3|nr:zinc finger protein [Capsaspora owczarzaki ATCC 30864]KJE96760.1 zinc finger protein [Capsaspora owczarzaki ATCC 30864]|eukprot:XP_004343756.2 zinc finger protein [Capsaspora owczarzaki ATCC 30864]
MSVLTAMPRRAWRSVAQLVAGTGLGSRLASGSSTGATLLPGSSSLAIGMPGEHHIGSGGGVDDAADDEDETGAMEMHYSSSATRRGATAAASFCHAVAASSVCSEGTADAPASERADPQLMTPNRLPSLGKLKSAEVNGTTSASSSGVSSTGSAGGNMEHQGQHGLSFGSLENKNFDIEAGRLPSLAAYDPPTAVYGRWLVADPCGLVCAIITQMLVMYAWGVMIFFVCSDGFYELGWDTLHIVAFSTGCFMAQWSHLKAMMSNPGTVPRGLPDFVMEKIDRTNPIAVNNEIVTNCVRCNNYKPTRAHHCSVCRRCVRKMDHHCPWINNCVGQANHKYFLQFVSYILTICIYLLVTISVKAIICVRSRWVGCEKWAMASGGAALIISVMFEAALFGLFTSIMLVDQVCNLSQDETGIERLQRPMATVVSQITDAKKKRRRKQSTVQALVEVFGSDPGWLWLLPVRPVHPRYSASRLVAL